MMIPFSFFFFFNLIGLFRNSAPTAVLYAFGRYKRSALKTIYSRAPKVSQTGQKKTRRCQQIVCGFAGFDSFFFLVRSLEKETALKFN